MIRKASFILLAVFCLSLLGTWSPTAAWAQGTISGPPLAEFYRPVYEPPTYSVLVPSAPVVTVVASDCRRCARRVPMPIVSPVIQPAYIAPQVPIIPMMPGSPTMSAFYVPTGPVAVPLSSVGIVPPRGVYRRHAVGYPAWVQPVVYPLYWYPG